MSSSGGSSRQKSCNGCVKSKRRCDKRQPACGRCIKQRYLCIYGGQMEMTFGDSADAPFSLDCLADPTSNSATFIPHSNALPMGLGTDMELMSGATFQLNNAFAPPLVTMPENNSFLANTWPSLLTEISSVPCERTLARKDYSKMADMCDDYAPWQLADPSTRVSFTMGVFKKFQVAFAHDSCTLYMHRYLYKDNMPSCMLQAFSTCLLYTNQTASNRAVVLRVLHENVTDLKATANNMALTPPEKLARVHALMLYQTIRMFDGDITLGQQADDDAALLESWNKDLCKVRDNLDDLVDKDNKAVRKHLPESWEKKYFETQHRVLTYSSHLWNAQNSFDFFLAWKEKPLYIMSAFNFDEFLKRGTGDDLDDFAYYFLALYFGVNEIKTFCYETSGRLVTLT
ncbi:hypothetical protein HD806DRAFT_522716 [Xylariaceae sp. AK1471]|nr:hypothetical protein HD806DRAFT_522716 [Xylariaceae sp. AK1471]